MTIFDWVKENKNFIKHENRVWKKIIIPRLAKHLPKKIHILDVGPAFGCSLLNLAESNLGKSHTGVEPRLHFFFPAFYKKYLKHNIQMLSLSGHHKEIEYGKADLIIKTFNPFVSWKYILAKAQPKFILTDISRQISSKKYELIDVIEAKPNVYLLYKRC